MPDAPGADVFEPMGGRDTGEPMTDHKSLAREAAAAAVRGENRQAGKPGTQMHEGNPSDVRDRQAANQQAEPQEGEPLGQEGEPQEGQQTQESEPDKGFEDWTPAVTKEDLDIYGVELPVQPDEVPEDFRETYDRMAESFINTAQSTKEARQRAAQAEARIKDFSEKLSTPEGQEQLILTLAMSNAETFNKAAEVVNRMAEDPEYAESVRRGLEAQVKLEAAQRMQRASQEAQLAEKATRIENRTVRMARSLGIDPEWAKQEVANRILRNEAETGRRDITVDQVDDTLRQLAKRAGAKRPQRVKSPQTQQREEKSPQTQAEGAGKTPSDHQQAERRDVPSQRHALDSLRDAISQSVRNVDSKGL